MGSDREPKYVLDAGTVIAMLHREAGWEKAARLIYDGVLPVVNAAEVVGKIGLKGLALAQSDGKAAAVAKGWTTKRAASQLADIRVCEITRQDAILAGELAVRTARQNVSLADRLCLAVGFRLNLPVATSERMWPKSATKGIKVVRFR